MKNIASLVFLSLVLSLTACYSKPYFDRNGKKFRNVNEAAEEWHVDAATVAAYNFEMNTYIAGQTAFEKQTQFVLPEDVLKIVQQTQKLLVIMYNPECGFSTIDFQLAKYAENSKIPYLLLSSRYSSSYIDRYINRFDLKNKNRYIIPSGHYFSHILIRKTGQFWGQLAPELYDTYKDELTSVSYMILKKGARPVANIEQSYLNFDQAKEWVEQHL